MTRDPAQVCGPGRERPGRGCFGSGDRGYATVCVLAVAVVVVTVGLAGAMLGDAVIARHRAQGVADLAALAGAYIAPVDPSGACAAAGEVVAANDASLVSCHSEALDVTVTVAVPVSGMPSPIGPATATARAGPASPVGPTTATAKSAEKSMKLARS